MANNIKDQQDILTKLNIHTLNPMQQEAIAVIETTTNTVLLSPTGTGKTLGFSLPLLKYLDSDCHEVQALILVPTRELAIQIEQVIRTMGSGFKVNAVYGGRPMSKDKIEIKHNPAVLIGTPGRILDMINKSALSTKYLQMLIVDEADEMLSKIFLSQIQEIFQYLPGNIQVGLFSATMP
ncbi:MAG: DEAD/DEAH box helicase, partial [Flavobacteriaceae bacterium]|nr:DEAD/DEAH box helicase [Flavobacteriaceae bacterium]